MFKIFLSFIVLISNPTFASDYLNLSKKLASLRTQVEKENEDVQELRGVYSSKIRSLSLQQAEIDATIRKEEIRNKQLKEKIARLSKKMKDGNKDSQDLSPVVLSNIENLKKYIETSIPYKQQERLENLIELKKQIENNEIQSQLALTKLWSAYEDEMRLTKDNIVSKEEVEIEDSKYLAEVIKLGSLGLLYKNDKGMYGKIMFAKNNWVNKRIIEDREIEAVDLLFDGFKKQIKTAEYKIPNLFEVKEVK